MTVGTEVRHLSGMAKGLSGWRQPYSHPVVIPAKAGIHAYRDVGGRAASGTSGRGRRGRGGEGVAGFSGRRIRLSPHDCHSRYAGMYAINHWIPACAGMTRGGLRLLPGDCGCPRPLVPDLPAAGRRRSPISAARSRRGSTTCIHAGMPSRRIQDFLHK